MIEFKVHAPLNILGVESIPRFPKPSEAGFKNNCVKRVRRALNKRSTFNPDARPRLTTQPI